MNISLERAFLFIASWLRFRVRQVDMPGLSVAIYADDRIVFSEAFGLKDVVTREPLQTDHLLRAASLSKLFAATAMMQLHERGEIDLDAPVSKYLPWLQGNVGSEGGQNIGSLKRITVKQLLAHCSGLSRDGAEGDFWHGVTPFPDTGKLRRLVFGSPLYHSPSGVSKYSNLAFGLVGEIIERITGEPYASYIQKHIIDPLGLQNTFPDYTPAIHNRLATGYTRLLERRRKPFPKNITTNALITAGGICSTAEDICKLMAARFPGDNRILDDPSKVLLHGRHVPVSKHPDRDGYRGFGCVVVPLGGRTYVRNIGSFPGHHCIVMADMDHRLAIAVFTTSNDAYDKEIMDGIISIVHCFEDHAKQQPDPKLLGFEGRFLSARGVDEFVVLDQGLVAIQSNSWQPFASPESLEFLGDNIFRVKKARHSDYAEGELVKFNLSDKGVTTVSYTGKTLWPESAYLKRWRT